MEASGTPSPAAPPPPPPPPTTGTAVDDGGPSGLLRVLAGLWALVALVVGGVFIAVAVELNDSPRCAEQLIDDCYLGSETEKLIGIIGLGLGGVLLIVGAFLSLAFAFRRRAGRLAVQVSLAGAVVSAIALAIG